MAACRAAEELNDLTHAIEQQLSGLQLQVARLKQCKTVLSQQHQKRYQDRGTQADVGPQINPLRHVRHLDHNQPFSYQQPNRKLNWKRLRQLDFEALAESGDTAAAMQLFEDIAYGDVEQGSIYDLSEANLIKVIKVAQLQLQYMQYKLEEKVEAEQALEDDSLALAAGLSGLAAPSFGDIHKGLGLLESDIKQLGLTRVDGLIQQGRVEDCQAANSALLQVIERQAVRVEERQAAKSALLQTIQKTKQQVDAKYGVPVASDQTIGD